MKTLSATGRMLIERTAEGAYIVDVHGRRFLDFFCAGGVFNVGHGNPAVRHALEEALRTADFGGVFYLSQEKMELAKKLAETTPEGLEVTLPAVGGGEAIDLAIKLALGATGRGQVICGDMSFHGTVGLSAELGPERLRDWYRARPLEVKRVAVGDIGALEEALDEHTAACVFEPLRSLVDGLRPGRDYWQEARRLCDLNGTLLIIDEVVCGMGRLGVLWGSSLDDIQPDMLVSAKGLSGGHFPVAALVCRPSLLDSWGPVPFRAYSTYAWSNVGAAVAKAAIEEVERLLPRAGQLGDRFERELLSLGAAHPEKILEIRRTGLYYVLEFNKELFKGPDFVDAMFQRGVLIHASGAFPDAPGKVWPPLIMEDGHIDEFIEKADDALAHLGR